MFSWVSYVALHTLNKVVLTNTDAVQRHRNTILDCLRDGDISIRRRALELSYALINEQNVRVMTRELLAFLEVADNEFKLGMTTQISLAAERFAPNKRWHIDTFLRVLKLVGVVFPYNFERVSTLFPTGRKLRSRGDSLSFYQDHGPYPRTPGIYRFETLQCPPRGHISRGADPFGHMDSRRIQRSFGRRRTGR